MAKNAPPVPKGYHTVTPSLFVAGAAKALEFYKKALGAEELMRFEGPDGKIMHAEFKVGDSIVMLADEMPDQGGRSPKSIGGTPVSFFVYGENVDAAWKRAVDAGAKEIVPLADQFWGDRTGCLEDPFGAPVVAGPARGGPDAGADSEERGSVLLSDGELASSGIEGQRSATGASRPGGVSLGTVISSSPSWPRLRLFPPGGELTCGCL